MKIAFVRINIEEIKKKIFCVYTNRNKKIFLVFIFIVLQIVRNFHINNIIFINRKKNCKCRKLPQ